MMHVPGALPMKFCWRPKLEHTSGVRDVKTIGFPDDPPVAETVKSGNAQQRTGFTVAGVGSKVIVCGKSTPVIEMLCVT